ncbi:uncharacterized protein A4U43_C08F2060 [Asparagus officinalis]|nr:uncharacterized protein A4U43_C08F2060 [Asparagus officinalis]
MYHQFGIEHPGSIMVLIDGVVAPRLGVSERKTFPGCKLQPGSFHHPLRSRWISVLYDSQDLSALKIGWRGLESIIANDEHCSLDLSFGFLQTAEDAVSGNSQEGEVFLEDFDSWVEAHSLFFDSLEELSFGFVQINIMNNPAFFVSTAF